MSSRRQMERGATGVRLLVISFCGVILARDVNSQRSDTEVTAEVESGVSKIGGSHENLPPCRTDDGHIVHSNSSCIYTPPSGDKRRHKNGAADGVNRSAAAAAAAEDHGIGRGDMKGIPSPIEPSDPYDRHGRYWLVPPFLIGASSVIILYIVGHCLYLHCYAKRKIRQLAGRATSPPAIVFSDGDGPSVSSVPSFTPVVTYDGSSSYGRTGVMDSQSFIVYQAGESADKYQQHLSGRRPSAQRRSVHLQLPSFFKGKHQQQQRAGSVCSESAAVETSTSSNEPAEARPDVRRTSASICLVPVCRTISDPTGGANGQQHTVEWTPLQNVVYHPSFILSNNPPMAIPGANVGRDDVNAPSPFVVIQHPGADGSATDAGENVASKPTSSAVTSQPSTPRKTPFGRPEAVGSPLTSRPEVEAVPEVDEQS